MAVTLKEIRPPRLALAGGTPPGGGGGGFRMTARLAQAIRLLQLSRLELIAEIRRELGRDDEPAPDT
jgi:hypothetical protein